MIHQVGDEQKRPSYDMGITFPKFNSWPLKIGRNPKGNDRPSTTSFQGRAVKLRGVFHKPCTAIDPEKM